jgi:septal ring factor EnvC (AmiA/AmiB activator)
MILQKISHSDHYKQPTCFLQQTGVWVFILFIVSLGFSADLHAASKRSVKQQELKALQLKIESMRKDLQKDQAALSLQENALQQTELEIGKVSRNITELESRISEKQSKINELQKKRMTRQHAVIQQKKLLEGQIRASYATGRQEYLKILLNQEDPAAMGRILTYYDYFNHARTDEITKLNQIITEIEQIEAEVINEQQQISAIKDKRLEERSDLNLRQFERQRILNQLKQQLLSKDQQLNKLLKSEEELQNLLKALSKVLKDIPSTPQQLKSFKSQKGKMRWPTRGKHIAGFGHERNLGKLRWNGVVIQAKEGTNVRAITHGRIVFSDWLRGYGLIIIIDHGNGYMSLYGHNQSLHKDVGEWVDKGEVIASVGNSGGFDKTALYFEIRYKGKPTNPKYWCRG